MVVEAPAEDMAVAQEEEAVATATHLVRHMAEAAMVATTSPVLLNTLLRLFDEPWKLFL